MLSDAQQLLISTYVDGETTPDERVRAEQLLVEDAQARAFREELLSMSADLQALPEHRLPGDFAEQVLQAAEREMIVGETWPGDPVEHSPGTRERWLRRVAYAAATIAAAVLVSLFVPRDNEPLAHKSDQPAETSRNGTPATISSAGKTSQGNEPAARGTADAPAAGKIADNVPSGGGLGGGGLPPADSGAPVEPKGARPVPARPGSASESNRTGDVDRERAQGDGAESGKAGRLSNKLPKSGRGQRADDHLALGVAKIGAARLSSRPFVQSGLVADQFLAATYEVQVKNESKEAASKASGAVDDAVYRKARRRLANSDVTWTENSKEHARDAAVADGKLKQRLTDALADHGYAAQGEAAAEPVVLYIEATADQAQTLLAALDRDPAFRREVAESPSALLAEKSRFQSAAGFGGGGTQAPKKLDAQTAKEKQTDTFAKAGDTAKSLVKKDGKIAEDPMAIDKYLRAYRLSRTDLPASATPRDAVAPNTGPVAAAATEGNAGEPWTKAELRESEAKREGDKQGAGTPTKPEDRKKGTSQSRTGASSRIGQSAADRATGRLVLVFRLLDLANARSAASLGAASEAPSEAQPQPLPAAKPADTNANNAEIE